MLSLAFNKATTDAMAVTFLVSFPLLIYQRRTGASISKRGG